MSVNGEWKEVKIDDYRKELRYYEKDQNSEVCRLTIYLTGRDSSKLNAVFSDVGFLTNEYCDILEEKINSLNFLPIPVKKHFVNKGISIQRRINEIYEKLGYTSELSDADIHFLYNLDFYSPKFDFLKELNDSYEINSDFYFSLVFFNKNGGKDPRIEDIISSRDHTEDLKKLLKSQNLIRYGKINYLKRLLSRKHYDASFDKSDIVFELGLEYASDRLLKDKKFILKYIDKSDPGVSVLKYFDGLEKNIVMKVLSTKINDDYIYLNKYLLADKDVVMLVLRRNLSKEGIVGILDICDKKLLEDKDVIKVGMLSDFSNNINYFNSDIIEGDVELARAKKILEYVYSFKSLDSLQKYVVGHKILALVNDAPSWLVNSDKFKKNLKKIELELEKVKLELKNINSKDDPKSRVKKQD